MQIRPYQPVDENAVIALWRDLLFDGSPHNDQQLSLERKLAVDDELLLVAELDNEIVGTAMGGYDGHRGWIYSVAVHPQHQRRRIGAALLTALEELLTAAGCVKINLQIRAGNDKVVAFYEALGFAVEPRISMGKIIDVG